MKNEGDIRNGNRDENNRPASGTKSAMYGKPSGLRPSHSNTAQTETKWAPAPGGEATSGAGHLNLMENDAWPAVSIWEGGALSGIVSGLVLGIILMFYYSVHGEGFWFPLKLIAGTFQGDAALVAGPTSIVLGAALHVVMSAFMGILFAFVTQKVFSAETSLSMGILFGFCAWLAMTYAILPWLDPTLKVRSDMASGWWFGAHMVFGMFLVLTPYFELKTAPKNFISIARRRIMSESY